MWRWVNYSEEYDEYNPQTKKRITGRRNGALCRFGKTGKRKTLTGKTPTSHKIRKPQRCAIWNLAFSKNVSKQKLIAKNP
jgi:hypothetical protein